MSFIGKGVKLIVGVIVLGYGLYTKDLIGLIGIIPIVDFLLEDNV